MNDEIWKDIPNYEGLYQISNMGRVKSISHIVIDTLGRHFPVKEKIRKSVVDRNGYYHLKLIAHGHTKDFQIHQLVAQAFIPNPNHYKEINHKDEDKRNNKVSNLEWCTRKYNVNYHNLPDRQGKKVAQYDKTGKLIKIYPSIREAERETNITNQHIIRVCKGRRKSTGGYVWKYI